MAPTTQPTRSSTRIRERKEAAAKAAAAVKTNATTKSARKGKGKATPKTAPSKVAKRGAAAVKKTSRTATKKAYNAHYRFFMEPQQLSNITDQHHADGNDQMWAGDKFYAAGPGEVVPAGSIEIDIKVPSGLEFLRFPEVLKLVEQETMEEDGEMEEEGQMEEEMEEEEEGSDSELSECGYISDIHF